MTRGELSLGLCVLHKGKGLEVVGALGKLVVAVHVAIVHQAPTTLNKREHASALHSILGNLAIARVQGPCVGLVQVGKGVLPDALMTSSLGLKRGGTSLAHLERYRCRWPAAYSRKEPVARPPDR